LTATRNGKEVNVSVTYRYVQRTWYWALAAACQIASKERAFAASQGRSVVAKQVSAFM
jgi:hypothetical protein